MKTGYRKVEEQTAPADERYESESDYAAQKSEQYTYEVASVAYSGTKKAVNKVKEKVEDKIRDKVEDLENRREQKEAERLEQNQPRTETRTPNQQQAAEPHQPSSNPSVQFELRFETSGHEITPKEKANVLQQRFNQLEPKQSDEQLFGHLALRRKRLLRSRKQRSCRISEPNQRKRRMSISRMALRRRITILQ